MFTIRIEPPAAASPKCGKLATLRRRGCGRWERDILPSKLECHTYTWAMYMHLKNSKCEIKCAAHWEAMCTLQSLPVWYADPCKRIEVFLAQGELEKPLSNQSLIK